METALAQFGAICRCGVSIALENSFWKNTFEYSCGAHGSRPCIFSSPPHPKLTKQIPPPGFNPDKTFIFSDIDYMGTMYPLVCKVAKKITFNQAQGALGLDKSANLGKVMHTAVQAAPSFPECFPHIFGQRKDVRCLIPQAIDQDPFFRITRDIAPKLGLQKPVCVHSMFFPALQGHGTKMSSSADTPSTIFVTDTPEMIKKKVGLFLGECLLGRFTFFRLQTISVKPQSSGVLKSAGH